MLIATIKAKQDVLETSPKTWKTGTNKALVSWSQTQKLMLYLVRKNMNKTPFSLKNWLIRKETV